MIIINKGKIGEIKKEAKRLEVETAIQEVGQRLAQEKLKNMQKDAIIGSMGKQLAELKLDMIEMKGGAM